VKLNLHRSLVVFGTLAISFSPLFGQEESAEIAAQSVAEAASASTDFSEYATGLEGQELASAVTTGEEGGGNSMLFPGLKVDLNLGSSLIHDSNTTQTANGPSTSLVAFSFGGDVRSGDQTGRGGFYGMNYQGQAFIYDEPASEFGRDPFEHTLGGYVGVNGGYTRIRVDANYRRNNGNTLMFDQIQRETRRAASDDYTFNFHLSREISRITLETGAGYTLRDFDAGTGFNDGESTFGDVAGFVTPSFAPKTSVGAGFRFGSDIFTGNPEQDYATPSFRWRYKYSEKTSLYSSVGTEFRSVSGAGGLETQNLVYDGGIDWAATAKTGFNLSYYSRLLPSFVLNGQTTKLTGLTLQMNNRLPAMFQLTSRVGYENADYFAGQTGVTSGREDKFLRFSLDLNRPLMITPKLLGQWGVFYNYNQNDSNVALSSFDQNVIGIRVGLVY
jgi:hypothetical protein